MTRGWPGRLRRATPTAVAHRSRRAGSVARRAVDAAALAAALLVALAPALAARASDAGWPRPFTGAFSGTGRSCYGKLFVRTATASWLTPFSQCQRVRYAVVDRREDGSAFELALRLERRPKGCRYGVVVLRHRASPDRAIDWEVFGYATMADYRADRARGFKVESATAMSCALVADSIAGGS